MKRQERYITRKDLGRVSKVCTDVLSFPGIERSGEKAVLLEGVELDGGGEIHDTNDLPSIAAEELEHEMAGSETTPTGDDADLAHRSIDRRTLARSARLGSGERQSSRRKKKKKKKEEEEEATEEREREDEELKPVAYIHTSKHAHIHTYIHTYKHTHAHMHAHMHACMHSAAWHSDACVAFTHVS
jgi:hypothetical protein